MTVGTTRRTGARRLAPLVGTVSGSKVLGWVALAALTSLGCGSCSSTEGTKAPARDRWKPVVEKKAGARPLVTPSPERLRLAAAFRERHPMAGISFDRFTGYVKHLSNFESDDSTDAGARKGGGSTSGDGTSAAEAARSFVRDHGALLGVDETRAELGVRRVTDVTDQGRRVTSRVVRLEQRVDGLPVFEGEVIVQLTPQHRVIAVASALKGVKVVKGAQRLTRERALEIARALTKDRAGSREGGQELAWPLVYPLGGEGVRAWGLRLGSWLAILAAEDGETLLLRDETRHGPDVRVFDENEVVNGGATVIRPLTNLGASTTLSGTRFAITNDCEPVEVSAAREFRAEPGDVHFDDQMAYYHLERMASFFNALDVPDPSTTLPVFTCTTRVESCGAAYTPAGCAVIEGQEFCGDERFKIGIPDGGGGCSGPPSCRRPAFYADILYHEYTHRVLDTQAHLARALVGDSIHEGTADFYSSSVLGNPCLAESFEAAACFRDISAPREFPRDMGDPDPHVSGQVWGSALWALRGALGKDVAERLVRQGLVALPADAEFSTYAGNMIEQGAAYYQGRLGEAELAALRNGAQGAFCSLGIAAPYGGYVDLDVVIPDNGTRQSWSVSVPDGMVVDGSRGCRGGWDLIEGWENLKYFDENQSQLLEYTVNVGGSSLTVTMRTPDGCGGYERIPLTYRLYYTDSTID